FWHTLLVNYVFNRGNLYQAIFYCNAVSPQPQYPLIAFAMVHEDGPGVKVLIMNHNSTPHDFRINFGNTSNSTNTSGKVTFNFTGLYTDGYLNSQMLNNAQYPFVPAQTGDTVLAIPPHSTIMMVFDCHGKFQGRLIYRKENYFEGPKLQQIGNVDVLPVYNVCARGGFLGGTITVDTHLTNDTIHVNMDVNLEDGAKLTFNNCVVVFAEGTKITSQPGSSIEIKNTQLFGCIGNGWEGIDMNSSEDDEDYLLIQNSLILNAANSVRTSNLLNVTVLGSIFANGETALNMNNGRLFTITGNIFGGYITCLKTKNSISDFSRTINENRFMETHTGLRFENDNHNNLEIQCNEFRYKRDAIRSFDTNLKDLGNSTLSSGNIFKMEGTDSPRNCLVHSGSPLTYYFGSLEAQIFVNPDATNVSLANAEEDKECLLVSRDNCPEWDIFLPVAEEADNNVLTTVTIFPNPNSGSFNLKFEKAVNEETTIHIRDFMGRIVSIQKAKPNAQNITLEIEGGVRGIYFVSVGIEGKTITQKVLVQ
ncbi:MAG: T9SS type A sorting domain-containing protein, partial [Bacteroidetes bacterium]|nr:T9SS type A sorting domain-containing protein [Bacteroidota bacterium]